MPTPTTRNRWHPARDLGGRSVNPAPASTLLPSVRPLTPANHVPLGSPSHLRRFPLTQANLVTRTERRPQSGGPFSPARPYPAPPPDILVQPVPCRGASGTPSDRLDHSEVSRFRRASNQQARRRARTGQTPLRSLLRRWARRAAARRPAASRDRGVGSRSSVIFAAPPAQASSAGPRKAQASISARGTSKRR